MTEELYKKIEGLRSSELKTFIKSPDLLAYERTQPPKESDAFRIGSAVHMAYYEPEKFKQAYTVYDGNTNADGSPAKRSKADKDYLEHFTAKLGNKELLTAQEQADINGMIEALPTPEPGQVEQLFTKEINGVTCKVKCDLITNTGIIHDLKTVGKQGGAHPDKFKWTIKDFGYIYQMAFYSLVTGFDKCEILAVEKQAPYTWHTYEISEETLNQAKEEILKALDFYKVWNANGMPKVGYTFDNKTVL